MKPAVKLDVLKDQANTNERFYYILETLSELGRGRQKTTVSRLRRVMEDTLDLKMTDQDFIEGLKPFEDAGVGAVKISRQRPVYIEWRFNIADLSCAILDKPSPFKKKDGDDSIRLAPKPRVALPRLSETKLMAKVKKASKIINKPSSVPLKAIETKAEPHIELPEGSGFTVEKDTADSKSLTIKAGGVEIFVMDISSMSPAACQNLSAMLTGLANKK